MNRMTGMILMALGALLFTVGGFVYKSKALPRVTSDSKNQMDRMIDLAIADGVLSQREEQKIIVFAQESNMDHTALIQEAKSRIEQSEEDSETEIIDHVKRSGDDFEKYVVQKFNRKYFNVIDWAGDKYVDGIYAETTLHPDLLMELQLESSKELFYVECKWRKGFKDESVQFARKDQLERYRRFEKEKKIPVFIALGIGGKANDPKTIYTFPLHVILSNSITKEELLKYEKDRNTNFYYDAKAKILK